MAAGEKRKKDAQKKVPEKIPTKEEKEMQQRIQEYNVCDLWFKFLFYE